MDHEKSRIKVKKMAKILRPVATFCAFSSDSQHAKFLQKNQIYVSNLLILLFVSMFLLSRLLLFIMRKSASKSKIGENFASSCNILRFFAWFSTYKKYTINPNTQFESYKSPLFIHVFTFKIAFVDHEKIRIKVKNWRNFCVQLQHFALFRLILDIQKIYNKSKYTIPIFQISSFYPCFYFQDCFCWSWENLHQSQKSGEIFASSCKILRFFAWFSTRKRYTKKQNICIGLY